MLPFYDWIISALRTSNVFDNFVFPLMVGVILLLIEDLLKNIISLTPASQNILANSLLLV
jgi:hypothetical protein|uniref:Uncharacterized protein n=1 Tax=Siphoviridae sp. cthL03 TaxID=2825615 RepID=A0A8S5PG20_9CAUD|nr:hypothetical protein [uncultured Lachnoclostridium sp.]DAE05608.1 MAG TPA: hypothetical protein [Siphoviridae sp. cthL03]